MKFNTNNIPIFIIIQIEEALLERKKMELLQKYASDDLQAEEGEVKEMLGL